jgi:cold shock CspA family protein
MYTKMSTERLVGRVKWFNAKQGYGFITDSKTSADVFVHHTGLVAPENVYKTLREGEYVEYSTKVDEKQKTVAIDVTGICRGPLGCEAMAKRFAERKTRQVAKRESQPAVGEVAQATADADGFTQVGRQPSAPRTRGTSTRGRGGRGGQGRAQGEQQQRTYRKPDANSYAGKLAAEKKPEQKQ